MEAGDLRLGISDQHFWDNLAPGVGEGVHAAIGELTGKGARLTKLSLPEVGEARAAFFRGSLFGVEGVSFVEEYYPDRLKTVDPNIGVRFEVARKISGIDYYTELRKTQELGRVAADKLRHVDVLVAPTMPVPAPTLTEVEDPDAYAQANGMMTQNTQPINLLGLTSITMPVALEANGMPVGLQLIAGPLQEEKLLAVALACEKVLGNSRSRLGRPPLCAG
jgi:aspartyl-tRNA(Asn)/glutamyl-tRNA(Gln) amidotransferase subunit A